MFELTQKEIDLKNRLVVIRDREWHFPHETNYYELMLELVENIGSLDSELRDRLILNAALNIIDNEELTNEQLKEILNILLSENHLFHGIGLENDDSVFNRTFSLLIVQSILSVNLSSEEGFLTDKEVLSVYNDVKRYMMLEKDLRGFDKEKGWAHSTAHAADLLGTLVYYECIDNKELLKILLLIKDKVCVDYYSYINEEDERLINVIMNIYDRSCIPSDDIINWIYSFGQIDENRETLRDENLRFNKKQFLRSLYFRFKEAELPIEFMYAVESVLVDLPKYY